MFLPENHITYTATEDMQKICRPLQKIPKNFPSYTFNYGLLFRNGTHVMLTTDCEFYKTFFYEQGFVYESPLFHKECFFALKTGIYRTIDISPPNYINALKNSQYSPERSLVLVLQASKCCEIFNFTSYRNSHYPSHIATTKLLPLLKIFSLYFREQAKSLIKHAEKQLITLPNNTHLLANAFGTITQHCQTKWQIDKKSFLREVNFRRCHFEDPILANMTFSKREFECAIALLNGKTAEETAQKLFLSRRTVETHLENLKSKLGCLNKAELKKKLLSSVVLSFYQDCL